MSKTDSAPVTLNPSPSVLPTPNITPPPPESPPNDNTHEARIVGPPIKKKRPTKSMVWNHFEKLEIEGVSKAKCLHCGLIMSGNTKNGTSHLIDHLSTRCRRKHFNVDIRQRVLNMNRRADGTARVENTNFSQEISRKELANMIIMHEYPLSTVDHIGFRRFVSSLNPNFKIIGRNTLRSDIMKLFGAERALLKKKLENNPSRIAITTDMWTATSQKRGYMAVTGHYIDDLWVLHNKTLRFAYVPCPHTKDNLAQVLLDTLNMYNIAEKVSSIVVDNCSTNDAMIDILRPKFDSRFIMVNGDFLHMRCSAHILNLVVQDGLEIIEGAIENIRECVSFWTATPKRTEMFENKVKSLKLEITRKLVLDCKTRWNSTFLMLQSAMPYKNVFVSLKRQNCKLKFVAPSEKEWELAEKVCEKLKIFHRATEMFSGRNYPTANLFFRQICEIKLALTSWLSDASFVISNMASNMIEKFDKYWNTINGLLAIAAILDPRNKLECVDFYFTDIYGKNANFEIERVKSLLYDLMVEYQEKGSSSEEADISESLVPGKRKADSLDVGMENTADKWSQAKKIKKKKINVRSELDHYLEDDALPESSHFDILKFWNIELKYPTLQRIARDILAIPASTVASESAFSMGGRVVTPHRSRLHTNTIEALMCMQNWMIGQYSPYSIGNANSCASVLEEGEDGDANGIGEVVDIDSVLSVAKALSIQAHPCKELGKSLHLRYPSVYKDGNHKPEMAIAITEFEVLCGFVGLKDLQNVLDSVPEISQLVDSSVVDGIANIDPKDGEDEVKATLRQLFTQIMSASDSVIAKALSQLLDRLRKKDELTSMEKLVLRLEPQYPGDVGLLVTFLMNYVTLKPGEALCLGANELHAYVSGDCIECMATSDNVVRAGLTSKHRDVNTLCQMLTYKQGHPEILRGFSVECSNGCIKRYRPPFEEFEVDHCDLAEGTTTTFPAVPGPSLFLVTQGTGTIITAGSAEKKIKVGDVLFAPAGIALSVSSDDTKWLEIYRAGINSLFL